MKLRALVTGGSRGIGLSIKNTLVEMGFEVITPTRSEMDLNNLKSVSEYMSSNREFDVLVNNAGINPLGGITDYKLEDIYSILNVNLLSVIEITKACTEFMKKKQFGRIVNISSIWGQITKPRRMGYTVSKAGIDGLTRNLAVELASDNILVNSVAPGYVNTELTKQNNSNEEILKIEKTIPCNRMAEPKEIAKVVSFLVSPDNTYLTGQTICVDGGFTLI